MDSLIAIMLRESQIRSLPWMNRSSFLIMNLPNWMSWRLNSKLIFLISRLNSLPLRGNGELNKNYSRSWKKISKKKMLSLLRPWPFWKKLFLTWMRLTNNMNPHSLHSLKNTPTDSKKSPSFSNPIWRKLPEADSYLLRFSRIFSLKWKTELNSMPPLLNKLSMLSMTSMDTSPLEKHN